MKNLFVVFTGLTILTGMLLTGQVIAQSPEKINYQSVVRNSSGAVLANQNVGIRFQIIQSSEFGAAVYVETHTGTTNAFGLINLKIGEGNVLLGSFPGIDWDNGPYFLKIEIDPSGGTSYITTISTTQLLSVPYALHAKTVTTETDPLFSSSPASNITGTNISNWNNAFGWGDHAGLYKPDSWEPSWTDITAKPTEFTPSEHVHGNITNEGKIGTTAGSIITTGADGTLQATAGTAAGQMLYWNGSAWIFIPAGKEGQILSFINGLPVWANILEARILGPSDVYNSTTGKIWMDRNLGATQVANSSTDANSYGHLYQWGRGTDGHESRTSSTTSTLSSSNTPGHSNFILAPDSPNDWRSPQNGNLWQGVTGINNPCPIGYRLPTLAEWDAERLSWSTNNSAGAFASPLKLPVAGLRYASDGSLDWVGSVGLYWSSTVTEDWITSRFLLFSSENARMSANLRAYGYSVRCIKD